MDVSIARCVTMGLSSSPDYFVPEMFLTKHLIQYDLQVVYGVPVKVHENAAIGAQQFPHENEPLSEKLQEFRSSDLVLVRLFFVAALEFLFGCERGIYVDQLDPG